VSLKEGLDCYSEEESLGMSGDEEWEKEILAKLPAPFNKLGGQVYLKWKYPADIGFDDAGKILWEFYKHTFTAEELEKRTVGEVRAEAFVMDIEEFAKYCDATLGEYGVTIKSDQDAINLRSLLVAVHSLNKVIIIVFNHRKQTSQQIRIHNRRQVG
jgi:hypothetical protein